MMEQNFLPFRSILVASTLKKSESLGFILLGLNRLANNEGEGMTNRRLKINKAYLHDIRRNTGVMVIHREISGSESFSKAGW